MPDAYGNPTAEEVAAAYEAAAALIGQPQSVTAGDRTVVEQDPLKALAAADHLAARLAGTNPATGRRRNPWAAMPAARAVPPGAA